MNTAENAAPARGRIGLIELPALAETLSRCGIQVVTGPDFRTAATNIIAESKAVGAFPIVVADTPAPGLRAWVGRIQQTTPVKVAVMRNPEAPVVVAPSVIELHEPLTVDQILAAVGLEPLGGADGAQLYPEAAAPAAPAGIELPDFDDLFEDDEPAAAPAPADEDPFAGPVAPAAPLAEEDPFDAPAPDPAPAAAQPAELDEWDTPAPRTAPEPAPAVQAVRAVPMVQPAPVVQDAVPDLDEWDTPAPAAQPAPAPAAPAAPAQLPSRRAARALAQAAGQEWAAPAPAQAPAPAPAPVAPVRPVAPAPAAPVPEEWDEPAYQAPSPAPAMAAPAEDFDDWDAPEHPTVPVAVAPAEDFPAAGQVLEPFVPARAGAPTWGEPYRQHQQLALTADDASGIFDGYEASKLAGTGRSAAGLGSLVVSFAGKGGVGKSTTSLQLAHIAAEAGLRVVLVDGNSGQGDLRTFLRLNRTNLPTIYDAAIGSIKDAVLTPAVINQNREQNLGEINFAFVGAPPDDINDPAVVTDAVYRDVIAFCRRNADLVILDTQIVESADRTGVVNTLILPALVHDAWGIGVADMTTVGVNNLNNRLRKFINEGVPTSRLMVYVNNVHPEQLEMASKASGYFRNLASSFLGSVETDISIKHDMNAGRINAHSPHLRAVISKALLRITGNEAFRAAAEYSPEEERKGGFFGRIFGRKAA